MTSPGERSLTFGLGPVPAFNKNGHFYEYVAETSITWPKAKADAEKKSYYGRKGYLVTITDPDENAFIVDKTPVIGWIGGKDVAREVDANGKATTRVSTLQNIEKYKGYGDWRWVTGPEGELQYEGKSGLPFYKGYKAAGEEMIPPRLRMQLTEIPCTLTGLWESPMILYSSMWSIFILVVLTAESGMIIQLTAR